MSAHTRLLLEALGDAPWLPAAIRTAVIAQIGERLDGSGTPFALTAPELGALARADAVVDAVDRMTRVECQSEPDMALDACRALCDRSEIFDRYWVKRYLQRQGIHPIGSLVHFSRGYLAWVTHLDDDVRPAGPYPGGPTSGRARPASGHPAQPAGFRAAGRARSCRATAAFRPVALLITAMPARDKPCVYYARAYTAVHR